MVRRRGCHETATPGKRPGKEGKVYTTQSETTLEELVARMAELERANARMSEELAVLRAERPIPEQIMVDVQSTWPGDNVGNFSSSDSSVPAVTATGGNGAEGVYSFSNSGVSIFGYSASGTGVQAKSVHGYALYADTVDGSDCIYASSEYGNGVHALS